MLPLAITLLASACSSDRRIVDLGREGGGGIGFVTPDASSIDASADIDSSVALCIAAECPAPYATCGTRHACATNLSNDPEHCGACGNACVDLPELDVLARCVEGHCRYECDDGDHRDCNGVVDDGCEVNIKTDPTNCGTCGNACPAGVRCFGGNCGCPGESMDCNGECRDLNNDYFNCGQCGYECPYWEVEGLPTPPANMSYGCRGARCQVLTCARGYRDCDNDRSNGCEVNVETDPSNCGDCGKTCPDGQICGVPKSEKLPRCLCGQGQTLCGGVDGQQHWCADLLTDVDNCGACDNTCTVASNGIPNTMAECNQGRCNAKCTPGFGDCDGDPSNGCEANLRIDGSNCGACSNRCNTSAGQPCFEGACLMAPCDAGSGATK